MDFVTDAFQTRPVVAHGQGNHELKPVFSKIKAAFFADPGPVLDLPRELTVLTCNNGHSAMGLFERSAALRGIPCRVAGGNVGSWLNSRDKPRALVEALEGIHTPCTLYADSRDCLLIGSLQRAVEIFDTDFAASALVFGADVLNWPAVDAFAEFEQNLPGATETKHKYLNGGCWIGRTEYCRDFFAAAAALEPVAAVPASEQGLLKQLFPRRHPEVCLDYRSRIFFNCGFLGK